MEPSPDLTFPSFFNHTLSRFPDRDALALIGQHPISYRETGRRISAIMALLEKQGIVPGDKVAILGVNQPNWVIAYFAVTFMGAISVPLLPDFLAAEIHTLLDHSGAKALFVSSGLMGKVSGESGGPTRILIRMEDFSLAASGQPGAEYNPEAEPQKSYPVTGEDLAAIIYTSGTTGRPKGVMLSHHNICYNAIKGYEIQRIWETDRFLSILPLSHTYENTLGLILPVYSGASIHFLGKAPTPALLIPALQEVRPTTILTVPLIIEKIFRNRILPAFTEKRLTRLLYTIPPFRKLLHRIAGKKLMKTFGGRLTFFGVGGAKLDYTVERFLIESGFPYAVGYGLTECAPLLAGFNPQQAVFRSTGPACRGVELKIVNPDPLTGEGELWARGENIMKGYYREPALTEGMFAPGGWLKTGDLGAFDRRGNLFIRGRVKNMIVRSNGENVYPEEIESVINNFRYVAESLVVEQKGKLVALVHFNEEEIEQRYHHLKNEFSNYVEVKIEELRLELHQYVNSRVNRFSQVHMVVAHEAPFQKTATQKIKRFMYSWGGEGVTE
ncbi:MAG TPA: AMP-binding protein [Bacteroidales bacterium]|nr:AMP-binding protein [Bacteroidales bacterium]HPS63590.1 AMP-binding protein [Bacteroidales bacterium]